MANFLELVAKHKMFSFNFIKGLFIGNKLQKRGFSDASIIEEKPDGLHVEAMFDNNIIIPGEYLLVKDSHK